MMTTQTHPLVHDYLQRLSTESQRLPADQAAELRADIDAHLDEALPPGASEAEVRQVLDRLGSPAELVTAAGGGAPEEGQHEKDSGRREAAALVVLAVAPLMVWIWPVALVLWLAGLYLLITARRWSTTDKVLGGVVLGAAPVVVIAAAAASFVAATSEVTCSSLPDGSQECVGGGAADGLTAGTWVAIVVLALYAVLWVVTMVRLARTASRPAAA